MRSVLPVLLLLLLLGGALAQERPEFGRGLASRGLLAEEPTPFADLNGERGQHIGQERTLVLQFDHLAEGDWEPYMTRFGPERYQGLRAWADEQFPWIETEYDAPAVFVFLPRGTPAAELASRALRHQRFAARVVLRELFAGKAWIEVTALERLPEEIGEGSLLHAIEALRFQRVEAWDLAIDQFERALAGPLPPHARAELEGKRRACLEKLRPEGDG